MKKIVIFVLTLLPVIGYSRTIKLKDNIPIEQQLSHQPCKYVVNRDIDLNGMNLRLADGSTIIFKNGTLLNGTLSGSLYLKKLAKSSLKVNIGSDCVIKNKIPIYSTPIATELMQACSTGFYLSDDVVISTPVRLKSGTKINGNGHNIVSLGKAPVALYFIGTKNIVLSNISILKEVAPGKVNQNYAIYGENMSDLRFRNCRIEGRIQLTNKTKSEDTDSISKNITFSNCFLTCDLTSSKQGWEYGQDHLAFYSVKNIKIDHCLIESKNVNRVIKTSSYFPENKFEQAINCTDGIVFSNNTVTAKSDYGKQVWDMFCGTVNANITNNIFNTTGFSCVFEDKAVQPKYKNGILINSLISFTGNTIIAENAVLFKFQANKLCDSFVFKGNNVNICGRNLNDNTGQNRTTGVYLQGYKSCKILDNDIRFTDEASGLQFALVNFEVVDTEICNNHFYDSYRVYFAKSGGRNVDAGTFKYFGNKHSYSEIYKNRKTEISIAEASIQELQIKLCSDNGDDAPVIFNKETDVVSFEIDGQVGTLYEINSNDVRFGKTNQSSSFKHIGNKWIKH